MTEFSFERAGKALEPSDLYGALAEVEGQRLQVKTVKMSQVTKRDLYTWTTNVTGWALTDKPPTEPRITRFGEFLIVEDNSLPPGAFTLVGEPPVEDEVEA